MSDNDGVDKREEFVEVISVDETEVEVKCLGEMLPWTNTFRLDQVPLGVEEGKVYEMTTHRDAGMAAILVKESVWVE